MEKISKDDLILAREIALKINNEEIKDVLKQIPDEKRAYLLNLIYELVTDEKNNNLKIDSNEFKKIK